MSLRAVVIGTVVGVGMLFVADAGPARAQHMVTDNEAGKLTLDALTATPQPAYRPMVRSVMAMRRAHRPGYVSRSMHASTRVAFRRHVHSRWR